MVYGKVRETRTLTKDKEQGRHCERCEAQGSKSKLALAP